MSATMPNDAFARAALHRASVPRQRLCADPPHRGSYDLMCDAIRAFGKPVAVRHDIPHNNQAAA